MLSWRGSIFGGGDHAGDHACKASSISATRRGCVINRKIISPIGLGLVCMLDMFPSDVWLK